MTKVFVRQGEEEWKPPRPNPPTPTVPAFFVASSPRKPVRSEVIVSAAPGHIYLDARDPAGHTVLRGDCQIEARAVQLLLDDVLAGQARWTGSSFGDLTWLVPVSAYQKQSGRLIEEALVRAWSDPDVRRAASTSPIEAVLCGVRPEAGALDAGDLGRELGDLREHEALDIVRRAMQRFSWALRARRATPEEDAEGKDIVVETTDGELFVQVKNSAALVADWRRKHSERLGARAFVVTWNRERPPSPGWIEAELERAYRSIAPQPQRQAPIIPKPTRSTVPPKATH